MTAVDTAAAVACRATHPVRWEYRATTTPCDSCLTGARGLEEAGLLVAGETLTEWSVVLDADDELVRDHTLFAGHRLRLNRQDSLPLRSGVKYVRERTTYPDRASEWQPVES